MAVVMMSDRRTMVPPDFKPLGQSDLHKLANIAIDLPVERLGSARKHASFLSLPHGACGAGRGGSARCFDLPPIQLRLVRTLEDMRRNAASLQGFAELDAQEAGGGVARHAR